MLLYFSYTIYLLQLIILFNFSFLPLGSCLLFLKGRKPRTAPLFSLSKHCWTKPWFLFGSVSSRVLWELMEAGRASVGSTQHDLKWLMKENVRSSRTNNDTLDTENSTISPNMCLCMSGSLSLILVSICLCLWVALTSDLWPLTWWCLSLRLHSASVTFTFDLHSNCRGIRILITSTYLFNQ